MYEAVGQASPLIRSRRKISTALAGVLLLIAPVCLGKSQAADEDIVPRTLELLDLGYKLPIEIVSVRNLNKKEHWVRDLEVEIRNISAKPIYEIYFTVFMPDDRGKGGAPCSVSLEYGRLDLIHPRQRPSAEDKPFGPGEVIQLRVSKGLWRGYEQHLLDDNVSEHATYRVRITVLAINFGDGTGFTNGGIPFPREPSMESKPQQYIRVPLSSK